jgi:hypothetical protein
MWGGWKVGDKIADMLSYIIILSMKIRIRE